MIADPDALYRLLPVVVREHDRDNDFPLRALLRIIAGQAAALEGDMWQLYADHFIETCQDWVIPYIGDLVSSDFLFDPTWQAPAGTVDALFTDLAGAGRLRTRVSARARADVANTIRYRRRKGTLANVEALARDVTGWGAHVVEMRERLAVTQWSGHPRPQSHWADLRSPAIAEPAGGPFDTASRSLSIREAAADHAEADLAGVAVFLWRLESFPLTRVPARRAGAGWRFDFSPAGGPSPLFRRPAPVASGLAARLDIAAPVQRDELEDDLAASNGRLYGDWDTCPDCTICVYLNGTAVGPRAVECAALDPWPRRQPEGRCVVIDPATGRLAIGDGWPALRSVDVSFWYGFSGPLGGGPYDRQAWLIKGTPTINVSQSRAGRGADGSPDKPYPTLLAALQSWVATGRPHAVISVLDSRTYALPDTIRLPHGGSLAIEAADGQRPLLRTAGGEALEVTGDRLHPGDAIESVFTLSGLLVEGHVRVTGALRKLRLLHTTLIPGRALHRPVAGPSLTVEGGRGSRERNRRLRVEIAFSITGPLRVPEDVEGLWLLDSIVDGRGEAALASPVGRDRDAGPAWLERVTVLGRAFVKELTMAGDVIFTEPVIADRTQAGCVRYSYVAPGSTTPARFDCQPELAVAAAVAALRKGHPAVAAAILDETAEIAAGAAAPRFTSRAYGDPAYCQLLTGGPPGLATGGEHGAEMGAFGFLMQPRREGNLRTRLAEYLPLGLEPQIIFVT